MSLFKRVHTVKVPAEFLGTGEKPITLRFSQLNPKKMGKANLQDTLSSIGRQNKIMAELVRRAAQGVTRPAADDRYRVNQAGAGTRRATRHL